MPVPITNAQINWSAVGFTPTGGTLTAFILAAVSVRALSHSLNAFEMMTVRSAGGLVILLAMGLARPQLLRGIAFRHMRLQLARNVAHFASQICWTVAIMLLPFATVFALEFTIPAWVTLLAVLFLGERMTLTRAVALASGAAGDAGTATSSCPRAVETRTTRRDLELVTTILCPGVLVMPVGDGLTLPEAAGQPALK